MPVTAKPSYSDTTPLSLFQSRRSVVHSTAGIVSCSQPLAARCGQLVLERGGNAADAAVAVAAGLNITEPGMTGIGGDAFCLFYRASDRSIHSLNGSGRSGAAATLEQVRADLGITNTADPGAIPLTSVHSVTVPGAAAAWVDTVTRFGSGTVTLAEVLEPAIKLCEQGYPVSEWSAGHWSRSESLVKNASPNCGEMLKDGTRSPRAGEMFKSPTLGNTFRTLAAEGRKGFYEGRIAEEIVKVTNDLGGRLTLDDLKAHGEAGSLETEAISLDYNVYPEQAITLWEHPPNSQGLVALLALGIIQELQRSGRVKKFGPKDHLSTEYLHVVIEALQIAFSDGIWFITDPEKLKTSVSELLNQDYLSERAKLFDPSRASAPPEHGSPGLRSSDTQYFSVTDAEGNGCSFINSNYAGFGTGIIPKGCGFTLQNRGNGFSLVEGHPNVIGPRKRPYHTIGPALITNTADKTLHSVVGIIGAFMQPQGQLQILLNTVAFGLDPQQALDCPRLCIGVNSAASKEFEQSVFVEEGMPEASIEGLRKLGHTVEVLKGTQRIMFGAAQMIRCKTEDGKIVYSAGSDMRADGHAVPML